MCGYYIYIYILQQWWLLLYRCAREKYSSDSSIPLTGDPEADKDIIAFYKARQQLIDRAEKKH